MSKIYDYLGDIDRTTLLPKYDTESGQIVRNLNDATNDNTISPPPTSSDAVLGSGAVVTSNELDHESLSGLPETSRPETKVPGMNLNAIDPALFEEGVSHESREMAGPQSEPARSPLGILPNNETNTESTSDQISLTRGNLQKTDTAESIASQNSLKSARRLSLETLEIEKVTLHVITLYKTIDWTKLTSLTLLNCGCTENLWACLQDNFPPRKTLVVATPTQPTKKRGSQPRLRRMPSSEALSKTLEYPLSLKRIHTNHVSSSLISFLKYALAPDSLEWLFLQDSSADASSVTLDTIYRGPLRRHRSSLTKVLIDSASGTSTQVGIIHCKVSILAAPWSHCNFLAETISFTFGICCTTEVPNCISAANNFLTLEFVLSGFHPNKSDADSETCIGKSYTHR